MDIFITTGITRKSWLLLKSKHKHHLPTDRTNTLGTGLVLFSVLTIGIGQSMTFALLAPLGREIGFKEVQVGIIISCAALTFTLMSPVWGRACDRLGRKPIMLLGMAGYVIGCTTFASMFLLGFKGILSGWALFLLVILTRVMMALLMSAGPSAAAGYIADTTNAEQRVAGMGRLGAARTLGAILGPALSGVLAVFGLLAPLYIAAGITLISTVLLGTTLKEPRHTAKKTTPAKKLKWLDRRYRPYVLTGLLTFISFSMMGQTIGFYFQDIFSLNGQETAQALGTGMMISALMSFFSQSFLVNRLKLTPLQLMRGGLPLLIVGYALLPFISSLPLAFAILGGLGLGLGLVAPGFTAGASLAVGQHEQGAIGGIVSACPAGGFIIGPLFGTSLYQLGHSLPYICASLLVIPLFIYIWRLDSGKYR